MSQTPLRLTGPIHVSGEAPDLYEALGQAVSMAAERAVEERGVFHLALSGGSTPERFYMHLATEPTYRSFPWDKTHLWIVDERCVPLEDEKSNWRMIRESLADHVPMKHRQQHPVPTTADDPAGAYERELRSTFGERYEIPRIDFVLLGMGDDCHTASLFPHSPALRVNDCCIAKNEGKHVTPPPRVTMTYCTLNAARDLAVLVTGEKKYEALRRISDALDEGSEDVTEMPILGIAPIDGEVRWYLDGAAAGTAN